MNSNSDSGPKFGAIILAASRGQQTVAEFGTAHKCSLDVGGQPMLMRVLEALEQSRSITQMVISIDAPDILHQIPGFDEMAARCGIKIRQSKPSAPESAADAIEAVPDGYPILLTTADNVLLSPEAVDAFCTQAAGLNCDIAVGLLTEQDVQARFPDSVRTFWRFRDGGYKACNLFALITPRAGQMISLWRHAEKNRKKPWKVAALMGPGLLISFILRWRSLHQLFAKVSKRLNVRIMPVILPFPEIAIDVDRRADIIDAEKVLASGFKQISRH